MIIIPAIDLKDGQCVRLRQGRMDDVTVFSDNPVEMAGQWVDAGAQRLHLVDLNGAFEGKPVNADVIHAIVDAFPDLDIQVGGGIRDEDTIQTYILKQACVTSYWAPRPSMRPISLVMSVQNLAATLLLVWMQKMARSPSMAGQNYPVTM